jgi:hypothetical protein
MNEVFPVDEFDPAYLRGNTKLKIQFVVYHKPQNARNWSTPYSMANNKNLRESRKKLMTLKSSNIFVHIYTPLSVKHMFC